MLNMEYLHIGVKKRLTTRSKYCKIQNMKKNDRRNLCRFVPLPETSFNDDLTIINFVKESEQPSYKKIVTQAVFRLYLVTAGKGTFSTMQQTTPLSRGSMFITYPATPFTVSDEGGLEFMFISFFGSKAYNLLSSRGIESTNSAENGFFDLIEIWEKVISSKNDTMLAAEGVLLVSLSCMGLKDQTFDAPDKNELAEHIRKLINENYCNNELSLSFLAEKLSYNEKYISTVFKRTFGTTIHDYVTNLRINNALQLIDSGITSVKEISAFCGYNDALYFSKAFRKVINISPSEYIKNNNRK